MAESARGLAKDNPKPPLLEVVYGKVGFPSEHQIFSTGRDYHAMRTSKTIQEAKPYKFGFIAVLMSAVRAAREAYTMRLLA
ncbi:MAG TPA: hypothetical protein VK722_14090 [Candidatus Aquilonibacter sp.]|nr:hypothetical protein [Candidatus Aquilonibacter sp.]